MATKPNRARTGRKARYPFPESVARSAVMTANRSVDTGPETVVRSLLHRSGLRFRKNLRVQALGIHVRPDIVFTRLRVAVFIDGCFWHRCPEHGSSPRHNAWYWLPKLKKNVARDRRAVRHLAKAGWVSRRYWEHEPPGRVATAVAALVGRRRLRRDT